MGKLIIGLSGKKGSGKDTVCQILQRKLGHGKRFAFADPIKEIAAEYFGISRELGDAPNEVKNTTYTDWLWEEIPCNVYSEQDRDIVAAWSDKELPVTRNGKKGPMTVREVLQWIGTEIFRQNMHKDFWVKATFNRIKADKSKIVDESGDLDHPSENLYFITDVRFPNEVKAIKDAGGKVIRIFRGGQVSNDPHPSETSLDPLDKKLDLVDRCTVTELTKDYKTFSGLYEVVGGNPYDFYIHNNHDLAILENICDFLADCIKGNPIRNENS